MLSAAASALACACLGAVGPGDAHRINWARAEQGAKVVRAPKIHPVTDVGNLVGENVGGNEGHLGHTIFADEVQREQFVIDLGQERLIGRVFVGSGAGDTPRHPDTVTIRGSTQGADGPWRTLVADGDMRRQHTFVFENTPVRYLEVDFGQCLDERGTRVTALGAFTRYRCPEAPEVAQWLAALYDRGVPELSDFFEAADAGRWQEAVEALRRHYGKRFEGRPTTVAEKSWGIARDMAEHRFQFGRPVHTFGPNVEDIDWAYEFDYEWTNSLNRCGFWTHTANVYMKTGDARYAREIEAQLLHWIESCPLPVRPADGRYRVWKGWGRPARITWRSLDSAIRLWKLCALVPTFAVDPEHFSDRAFVNLLYSIWEHQEYLKDDDWDGGNWLSTVTSSVLDAAVGFPEFRDSTKWLAFTRSAFETNVLRDVREDGKEVENAVGYVQFAYASMFRVLKTFTEGGVPVDPEVRRRLDLVQDFIAWCLFPDMTVPMIGDSDRGGRGPIVQSWEFFGREDIRYIVTQGHEGEKPKIGSRYWDRSGWAVMRSPWGEGAFTDALHMVFKAAPMGGHSHQDQLSATLYAYGRPLLIDPGRYNYRQEGREHKTTPYHNTVLVDGQSQGFGNATFERWESTDEYDLAIGSHKLYRGVTHRRTVLFVKPHFWLVRDDLESADDHRYEQRWHFPEDANLAESDGHVVTTQFPTGGNLTVAPLRPIAESLSEEYMIAYNWDELTPGTRWIYVPSEVPMATLLIPHRGVRAPELAVEELSLEADETSLRVRIGDASWTLRVPRDGQVAIESR